MFDRRPHPSLTTPARIATPAKAAQRGIALSTTRRARPALDVNDLVERVYLLMLRDPRIENRKA
jgi:hypothetical protein